MAEAEPLIPRWSATLRNRAGEQHARLGSGADLEELLFGFMDGIVTSLALIAGLVAAFSSNGVILLAGFAATLAGSVSMFVGAYISSHARYELAQRELRREIREVEEMPEEERAEVREIYKSRGFTDDEVEILVRRITSDKKLWVSMMMHEELGFSDEDLTRPPLRHGAVIGLSYFLGSILPLLPFAILPRVGLTTLPGLPSHWGIFAVTLTAASAIFLLVGALKERFGAGQPIRGALQLLGVGLGGAAAVYLVSEVIYLIH
jgi:VIT1/CCC1 family predicted Fe2+/Mn2+ transporter